MHSFSIGIKGAPDLVAARAVAEQLGTVHHEVHFTPEEALDALPDIVYHLETFEQVRASVPMYLLCRHIKSLGFKMVLSGEGADELFGGYLYFHKAPDAAEFHRECRSGRRRGCISGTSCARTSPRWRGASRSARLCCRSKCATTR